MNDRQLEYFPETWDIGIKIAKYSSIIGQIILIVLFFKLFLIYKQEHSQFHVASTITNPTWLYITAFGAIGSAFCICTLYYLNHSQTILKLTTHICKIIQPLTGLAWAISRFCYYNFMLYRVLSIFQRATHLKLNKKCYYIVTFVIDIWLICLVCIAYTCMNYALDYKYRNSCVILQNLTLFGKDSKYALLVMTIGWSIDAIITLILLAMFLWRLCKMKHNSTNNNNNGINKWIRRQIFIGVSCTLTSVIFVFAGPIFGYKATYFGLYDQLINCVGITLTFDWKCNICLNGTNPFHVNSQALEQNVSSMEADVTGTNTQSNNDTANGSTIQLQLSVVDRRAITTTTTPTNRTE